MYLWIIKGTEEKHADYALVSGVVSDTLGRIQDHLCVIDAKALT